MIEEWVIRTLLGMLIVNIFIAGLYLILRGHVTHRFLHRYRNRTAAVMERMGSFSAVIKWYKQGESVHCVEPGLFTIVPRENIYIYTSPQSYEFTVDMWPYNGKGLIAGGIALLVASFAGFFWLLVGF